MYFGPEYQNNVTVNNRLNQQGWSRASVLMVNNFLVVDLERAEILQVKSSELEEDKEEAMKIEGWSFIDSNIARAVYVRSKRNTPAG